MHLYLIRHADAVPLGEQGLVDDAQRPLTTKGESQVDQLARTLQQFQVALDHIVSSPLVRAQQTADRLKVKLASERLELTSTSELAPRGSPKKLAKQLRKLTGEHIALVGHEPDLGQLAAWLIGGKRAQIAFAKAGVACIECEQEAGKGAGVLVWLMTPAGFVR